ncbi:MAG: hypothetical protein KatS3mg053_3865 [Candidatus Roseilinea sp.]|nr:MAG: hypothetical protein KatS3mg053_3865 [Candidatus Roseilinea sp.]
MRQRLSWLLLAVPVFVVAVIGIGIVYFAHRNMAVQIVIVPGPPGAYGSPTWVDEGLVVGIRDDCQHVFCTRLYYLKPDGSERRMLSLPDQAGCDRNGFEDPARLPDGRLGYILRCGPTGEFRDVLYMMAYNLDTEQVTPLLSYPLPSPLVGTGGYSWNPEMTRGITSDGNGRTLYEQLYWIEPDHWESLDIGFPQAYGAAWSPDGQQIAFFGAPEQGLEGIDRLDAVYNLYLMKPDGTDVRPLVTHVTQPV